MIRRLWCRFNTDQHHNQCYYRPECLIHKIGVVLAIFKLRFTAKPGETNG